MVQNDLSESVKENKKITQKVQQKLQILKNNRKSSMKRRKTIKN